ncbi:MAG: LysR substrate-binding domain-containing protein [Ilumatobacteraceae bacterium]
MNEIDGTDGAGVSDAWLRAFVVASRAGSLSAAARELGIGQSAVSHAVARLERSLGTRVFDRVAGGVRLTATGRTMLEHVGAAFDEIDRSVAAARSRGDVVTVSVSTSLAAYWLLPRLPAFKRLHPDVELRVITTDSDRDVGRDAADLWIPLGVVHRDDLVATEFCREEVLPVAAASVADRLPFDDASSLLQASLLHLEERYAPRFDWGRWFREHHVRSPVILPGSRSNDYSLVVQGAIDGQGVALGWWHIVGALVESGRLVALAPAVRTDQSFQVLHRRQRTLRSSVEALLQWLTTEGARLS